MELIVKPTELCNFKCTFCSSTQLVENKASKLSLERIFLFLKRFPQTKTIIVNGGDPLMMPPDYYWEIIHYIEKHKLNTYISFTSNLWDFYLRPNRWEELFRHEKMGITTSFNYGDTRKITESRIYTEDDFWKVSNLFLEKIGHRPDFISVINDENEDLALKNVELAKKMNVECKLNYAMASGEESRPYQLSKIYDLYLEVYDRGLMPWEFNTKQMVRRLIKGNTCCPQNRSCDSTIRCLQPEGDYYSCGAFGDDKEYAIDFDKEILQGEFIRPLQNQIEINVLKTECYTCPMFEICNGCKKTIKDMTEARIVEDHCSLMKKNASRIIEINEKTANNDIS